MLKKQFYNITPIRSANFFLKNLPNESDDDPISTFEKATDNFIEEITRISHNLAHNYNDETYSEERAINDFSKARKSFSESYKEFKGIVGIDFNDLIEKLDEWLLKGELVNDLLVSCRIDPLQSIKKKETQPNRTNRFFPPPENPKENSLQPSFRCKYPV